MKATVVVFAVMLSVSGGGCSRDAKNSMMKTTPFFATPPKAERAVLRPYGSETLSGQFGILIETEPLTFTDPASDRELEPEIHLGYLTLRSVNPADLENTRFKPDSNYEGSFYFLAEHNWVDLKEIRFLNATGNTILAEYDLVIHLPRTDSEPYPITLRVATEIKSGMPQLAAPRSFEGLGVLVQDEEDMWKGTATYHESPVEIELRAERESFVEIATYARSVISEQGLPQAKLIAEITEGLGFLADKLKMFNVSGDFKAEDFVVRRFYFHKRRHHETPEMIIGLEHPVDKGHWSITFYRLDSGHLNWVPRR